MTRVYNRNCCICGEFMPIATESEHNPGVSVCSDCSGETKCLMENQQRSFPCESADIQYHGGMFNRGEW